MNAGSSVSEGYSALQVVQVEFFGVKVRHPVTFGGGGGCKKKYT